MNSYKVVKYLFERKVCRINDTMDYVFEDEKPDENPFERPEDVRPAERLITYEYNKFKQRFANLRYTDEEDKRRKFIFTTTIFRWYRRPTGRPRAATDLIS